MTSHAPLISVLVTVFNRERYLEDALKSIANSAYREFEAIIVDDCSTDNSFALAENFVSKDSRFHLFKNRKNLGQFGNRNRAAELATGKYIKYLDSDDILYKHTLGTMLEAIEAHPTAAYAISSPQIDPPKAYPFTITPLEVYRTEFLGRGCLSAGPSGAIIGRENFLRIGGYRDLGVVSDIDLWYRLATKSDTVFMQPALVWWRRHNMQAFSSDNAEEDYLTGEFRITMEALTSDECPLNELERNLAIRRKKQHFARKLIARCAKRKSISPIFLGMSKGLKWLDLLSGLRRYY